MFDNTFELFLTIFTLVLLVASAILVSVLIYEIVQLFLGAMYHVV